VQAVALSHLPILMGMYCSVKRGVSLFSVSQVWGPHQSVPGFSAVFGPLEDGKVSRRRERRQVYSGSTL
jgi:hypothetical protein